jgi:hypothetical protein
MTKIELVKAKAKELLTEEEFIRIDKYIESIPVSGTKKATIWDSFLSGDILPNGLVLKDIAAPLSDEELLKIDSDIRESGPKVILDILDNLSPIPENLKEYLRNNWSKEMLELKAKNKAESKEAVNSLGKKKKKFIAIMKKSGKLKI